jgi:hypothetical protein
MQTVLYPFRPIFKIMYDLIFFGGLLFITAAKMAAIYLTKNGVNKGNFGRITGRE